MTPARSITVTNRLKPLVDLHSSLEYVLDRVAELEDLTNRQLHDLLAAEASAVALRAEVQSYSAGAKQAVARVALITEALRHLGTPYVFAAASGRTDAFDCSSFVQYVFKVTGVHALPRVSRAQAERGRLLEDGEAVAPGDLCFYRIGTTQPEGVIDHVAMVLSPTQVIHAFPNRGVVIEGYRTRGLLQVRRYL